MRFTLYERWVNGTKRYYFHYLDQNGRRIRKSTGCKKLSDAKAFLIALEKAEAENRINASKTPFIVYSKGFFDKKGHILRRWEKHGKVLKERTLQSHRACLRGYLLPWFKDMAIDDITAKALDLHLLDACALRSKEPLSGSAKNGIKDTLMIIMREAVFDELIPSVPAFVTYARNSRRQNTLTDTELQSLFPFNPIEFSRVWSYLSDEGDPTPAACFGTLSAIAVSCGLRSGEAIALSMEQIIPGKGLIIDRMLDENGNVSLVKKGTSLDPRIRVVPMSEYTLSLLDRWLAIRGDAPGLIFTYRGNPVPAGYLLIRFKRAMASAGIKTDGRRLTFHALRYTYNTRMKNAIPREILRDIIGHKNADMTDHYDRPVMEERLDEYRETLLPAVNGFWKM